MHFRERYFDDPSVRQDLVAEKTKVFREKRDVDVGELNVLEIMEVVDPDAIDTRPYIRAMERVSSLLFSRLSAHRNEQVLYH